MSLLMRREGKVGMWGCGEGSSACLMTVSYVAIRCLIAFYTILEACC